MDHSTNTFIKFSGPNGIDGKFTQALHETILARIWEVNQVSSSSSAGNLPRIKQRSGIGGIEKSLQAIKTSSGETSSIPLARLILQYTSATVIIPPDALKMKNK